VSLHSTRQWIHSTLSGISKYHHYHQWWLCQNSMFIVSFIWATCQPGYTVCRLMQGHRKNGTMGEGTCNLQLRPICNFKSFTKDQHSTQYVMENNLEFNIPIACYSQAWPSTGSTCRIQSRNYSSITVKIFVLCQLTNYKSIIVHQYIVKTSIKLPSLL
jgi:hypothetical protein